MKPLFAIIESDDLARIPLAVNSLLAHGDPDIRARLEQLTQDPRPIPGHGRVHATVGNITRDILDSPYQSRGDEPFVANPDLSPKNFVEHIARVGDTTTRARPQRFATRCEGSHGPTFPPLDSLALSSLEERKETAETDQLDDEQDLAGQIHRTESPLRIVPPSITSA